jgi:hypothetical protein
MNQNPIYQFPAINQSYNNVYVWLPLALLAICLAGAWWARRHKNLDNMRKNMLVMVLAFIGLTAFGAAAFKIASISKLKPVKIFADAIETPYGRLPFSDLEDASVQPYFRFKPMQPGTPTDSTRYLSLFKRNNQEPDILSEGDYPIDSIFDSLQKILAPN